MRKGLLILIVFSSISCSNGGNNEFQKLLNQPESEYFKKYQLFNDKNYLLTLTTIDSTDSYKTAESTAIVKLFHKNKDGVSTLLEDSIFARNPMGAVSELQVEFIDYNFDGIKDVVIPAGADPRGNIGYHLFTVIPKEKAITYVEGFNSIGNPKPLNSHNLIQSYVLAGPHFANFYKIDSLNNLKKIGSTLEFPDMEENIDSIIQIGIEKIKR